MGDVTIRYHMDCMNAIDFSTPQSVEVQLTVDDLTEFQHYHLHHSPLIRKHSKRINILLAILAAFVVIYLQLAWWRGGHNDDVILTVGLLNLVILAALLIRRTYYRRAAWSLKRLLGEGQNRLTYQKHRFTIDSKDMRIEHDAGHSATQWFAVEKVVTTPTAIYIYVSAVSAHILPRRAFANDIAFDEFAAAAAAFHRAAHPGRCLKCGYDLSKNTSGVCPECGAAIRSNVPAVA